MKKFFREYFSYLVYLIVFLYVLIEAYFNDNKDGVYWRDHLKEIVSFSLLMILIVSNYVLKKTETHIRDNQFFDSLQTDLTNDRNPFFLQIRKDKVPVVASNLLISISKAVASKEWWDFSYLSINDDLINEVEDSFQETNKTANLTFLKEFPFNANYVFIGTIQSLPRVDFPDSITFLPSAKSPYNIHYNRLYIFKKSKFFWRRKKDSFKLITDELVIEKKYKKLVSELNSLIEESAIHIHWDSTGRATIQDGISSYNEFIDQVKNS